MTDRGHTDPAAQYVDRLAGYDQRLQMLERSHVHEPSTPVGAMVDWPGGGTPPKNWALCDGSSLLAAAYPDLFAVLGYRYGGSGANFNLPNTQSRMTVGAGTGPGLTPRTLAAVGGAETVALTNAQTGAHTHGWNATTAVQNADHTHAFGTVTTVENADHTHAGTTSGASVPHLHDIGFTWSASGASGGAVYTIIGGSRNSGNNSPDHTHTVTTGGISGTHIHSLSGTTNGLTGNHAHGVSGTTDGGGATGVAHENMPPWMALNKIIRTLPDTAAGLVALTIMERNR